MKTHSLIQGTEPWRQYRTNHRNASDAPAMMGCSPYKSRSRLLSECATGCVQDIDASTQRRFDDGHRYESLACPLAEEIIGDDLYPVVGSDGILSASFDGITMCHSIIWEHKTLNDEIRAAATASDLGKHLHVQMEQQLHISKAKKCLFMASKWDEDGNLIEEKHFWYEPNPELRQQIIDGWAQFERDLADYEHIEAAPAAVAAPVKDLPALSIRVDGQLSLNHNLVLFGEKLESFIEGINTKPEDDQAFADAEAAIKVMERAETALGAAEASALGQISTVDDMVRTVATYKELARKTRLMLEKMVKARKEAIRVEIQQAAQAKATQHIAGLNARLGKPYMPAVAVDFAGVMKGKKMVSSLRDAVDTELARFKIEANAIADRIQVNLKALDDLDADPFLFADVAQIVTKANDDFAALVKLRIDEHNKAESEKAAKLRAEIAEEERVKAEAAAAAKPTQEAVATEAPAAEPEPRRAALAPEAHWPFPTAKREPAPATVAPSTPPALRLGQIGERLGFAVPADFLRTLGFEPAGRDKSAILYHERDFPSICAALIRHIGAIQAKQAA